MKLVRDRIQELFPENEYRRASPLEIVDLLRLKLIEEAVEVIDAKSPKDFLEEMADLMEVAKALRECYGYDEDEVEKVRLKKKAERGAFVEGLVLM